MNADTQTKDEKVSAKPKPTPGPWHVGTNALHGCRLIYGADGYLVAEAGRIAARQDGEMDANAALIAEAPTMADFVNRLARLTLEGECGFVMENDDNYETLSATILEARQITKSFEGAVS